MDIKKLTAEGQQTGDEELEEREFAERAHFECAASLAAEIGVGLRTVGRARKEATVSDGLDEFVTSDDDRSTLTQMAINYLARRVESGALDEKECAIVERMIGRITAEGRLDLTYGAYFS